MRISLCAGLSSPFFVLRPFAACYSEVAHAVLFQMGISLLFFPVVLPQNKIFWEKGIKYFITICVKKCKVGTTFWAHQDRFSNT